MKCMMHTRNAVSQKWWLNKNQSKKTQPTASWTFPQNRSQTSPIGWENHGTGNPDVMLFCFLGSRPCARIASVHGPSVIWAEAWLDNYTQASGYSRSTETTYEGISLSCFFLIVVYSNNKAIVDCNFSLVRPPGELNETTSSLILTY